MPKTTVPLDEFVCTVIELAAADSSRGWLAAMSGAAAYDVPEHDGARIAIGQVGTADRVDGRLTGRWQSVIGAEHADWLLLSIGPMSRALLARGAVHVEPASRRTDLREAGVCDVVASDADVEHVLTGAATPAVAAASAAAVVGSAEGVWRTHVEHMRSRLAVAGGDEAFDAVQVARAASDLDAARLQIAAAVAQPGVGTTPLRQAVARARGAADGLLASSRHALDASNPVTSRWRDVHAGCRLAAHFLD